jgi:hypothetical protein
LNAAQTS